jgi:hypothetical protein
MKKNWILEVKKKTGEYCETAIGAMIVQRALISNHQRKVYHLSKTMAKTMARRNVEWLQGTLSRLAVLEVLLKRRRILGKIVWWLYNRMVEQMKKPLTMRPVPGAGFLKDTKPMEGAADVLESADKNVEPAPQTQG